MTAQQHLAQFGVTVDQAREFILNNLDNLSYLLSVCQQFGVTNSMLAEIYGGVTSADVINYFSANGLDSSLLDSTGDVVLVPDDLTGLLNLISPNENTDGLSNATLRELVVAKVGLDTYKTAFDPSSYQGADDGIFTADELGIPDLDDMPATWLTMESLFYGTLINTLRAMDVQEATLLNQFTTLNADALATQDPAVLSQYSDMLFGFFQDPADFPLYSDDQIQVVATSAAEAFITVVGSNSDYSIISGIAGSYTGL